MHESFVSWGRKLLDRLDRRRLQLFEFLTDEIFDLDVREMIEPNSP